LGRSLDEDVVRTNVPLPFKEGTFVVAYGLSMSESDGEPNNGTSRTKGNRTLKIPSSVMEGRRFVTPGVLTRTI
jgi:hypothetical protein